MSYFVGDTVLMPFPVWPLIAMNLEFKPILNSEGSGDEKDNLNPEDFQ